MNQETVNPTTGEIKEPSIIDISFSSERLKILKAMLTVQSEMGVALKDSTNPHFKSKYADYRSVWDAVGSILNNQKVFYTVIPSGGPKLFTFSGLLMHESGEFMKCTLLIEGTRAGPQEFGSLSTYMKRYILQLMTGVATDEDDDGNKANPQKPKPPASFPQNQPNKPKQGGYQQPKGNVAKTPEDAKKQVNPSPNAAPKPPPKAEDIPPPSDYDFPPLDSVPMDDFDRAMMDNPLDNFPEEPQKPLPPKSVTNHATKAIFNDLAHCSVNPEDYIINFGTKFKGQRLGDVSVVDLANVARAIEEKNLDKTDAMARELMNFYNIMMQKRFQGGE